MRRAVSFLALAAGLGLMGGCATPGSDAAAEAGVQAAAAEPASTFAQSAETDRYLWLEEVEGDRALAWVRTQNERSLAQLRADPRYATLESQALEIIRATDRLTFGGYVQGYVSNFWQDADQVRGVWRRADFASWRAGAPRWETILDIDELARRENANWVYQGATCLDPNDQWNTPCILSLSNGGRDADVKREFDLATRSFVAGGFSLPEAKSDVTWVDRDTLLVATDWGPGTLTESGYPFVVKRLQRGQSLDQAVEIYRGTATDVAAGAFRIDDGARFHHFVSRSPTFFTTETSLIRDDGQIVKLTLPARHSISGMSGSTVIFSIQEAWTPVAGGPTFPTGALLSASLASLQTDSPQVSIIYQPGPREAYQGAAVTRGGVFVSLTRNVNGEVRRYTRGANGQWGFTPVALPANGVTNVVDGGMRDDHVFFSFDNFVTPPSIMMAETADSAPVTVQAQPARFDASNIRVSQFEATSPDGTRVPYFVVHRADLPFDGSTPTLLYGYGGFEVSMLPNYAATTGRLWLERGGAYVLANIRGGGEFGPEWHQAGLKGNRQRIYDDFIAVAENLVERRITSPRRLGAMGGSNGGLLMGVMLTQRPDLFNAVVVQVPLLDMLRYDQLLAGASWVDEYGDPDVPAERPFLERISPYQNLRRRDDMPVPFIVTSTKDDRVHPGHARKFAARMEELGMPFLYYENIDGGHSAAANLVEAARRRALEYTYLSERLMD